MTKYLLYQHGVTHINPCVYLHNFNKHLIQGNFCINNAWFIDNQSAKLQLNLSTETIVTAGFCEVASKHEVSSIMEPFV